ncbi:helicase-related protein [Thioalkalivibrio sp. ALJ15]|uniref:helicase-related protein n=1 Tax=Thioalkalivibrio sp. ALJ15 TaxID=748652 RepID=UPI0003781472|nr:helicase-related protein [Thioalkalivibrio sp. ALJ15]
MSAKDPFPVASSTADLFSDFPDQSREVDVEVLWPPPDRFPLNVDGRTVRERVIADLVSADSPLVVAGYGALEELIRLEADLGEVRPLRVLFGNEPSAGEGGHRSLKASSFPEEVEQYWLDRGISLRLSARLIHFRERLREGAVEARYWPDTQRPLHAKIYLGEGAVTLGSSNFSKNGLERQHEANARFTATGEPRRYREAAALAEQFWSLGHDYTDALLALLERLLHVVGWRDALARACGELLEGDWAKGFLQQVDREAFRALWPAQRQGIAQALYLLDRQGAVLIADATGSGKTRMGAHLLRAQQARIQGAGGMPRSVMIAPSTVVEEWEREASRADTALDVFSVGLLSHGSRKAWQLDDALRRARLLAVDECHNFHNRRSRRTRRLFTNHLADDVLLFTATPINRNVDDLVRIADLLGADNLQPSTLKALERVNRPGRWHGLGDDEAARLRDEIRTFTIRRTKRMFNALIDREPEVYRDHSGRPCRYPEHRSYSYSLGEPATDRERASRIRGLLDQLFGVVQIPVVLELSAVQRQQGLTEDQYRDNLLLGAHKLVRYRVMAALRSSRAALVEHLCGTTVARAEFGLEHYAKSADTGDVLGKLKQPGRVPENRLGVPLPAWLTDADAWASAHAHDHRILSQVLDEVRAMSPAREHAKVAHLARLAARHERVLAFDSRLITIAALSAQLEERLPGVEIWQATGSDERSRQAVLRAFRPGDDEQAGVALCSDSLSEGVNLQAASALVHLDMPSVIRVAEQRTGRVDRLDSPHAEVEVWWPRDAEEFALSADARFLDRADAVTELLGTNLPLPEDLEQRSRDSVDADTLIREYERTARSIEEAEPHDAFAAVRGLVEGAGALVESEIYEYYRQRSVRVLSRVSVVASDTVWAFFCLAGSADRAPRWFFFSGPDAEAATSLDKVAAALRERLAPDPPNGEIDEPAARWLAHFSERLPEAERAQLPLRKQRALQEMAEVLKGFCEEAARQREQTRLDAYLDLRNLLAQKPETLTGGEPDWEALANRWLELIRPYWYRRLTQQRRGFLRLRDLRKELIEAEAELGPEVLEAFATLPLHSSAEERVVAAILGMPVR